MPKQVLKLSTLGEIDSGTVGVEFRNALKTISADLSQRPHLEKYRELNLKIKTKPIVNKQSSAGGLDEVEFDWEIQTKVPAVGGKELRLSPQADGTLSFHSDLPNDPNDETLMDEAERKREELRNREIDGENQGGK